ncbi:MAG: hypothetical protein DCF20_13290 [Pseudanabaena sp.]|nr:MAG: hypothetical protein DCF20_13290 [Pseudanabaena sp.]
MKTTTISRHVIRNPEILSGEPIIDGTRTPVRAIVESRKDLVARSHNTTLNSKRS